MLSFSPCDELHFAVRGSDGFVYDANQLHTWVRRYRGTEVIPGKPIHFVEMRSALLDGVQRLLRASIAIVRGVSKAGRFAAARRESSVPLRVLKFCQTAPRAPRGARALRRSVSSAFCAVRRGEGRERCVAG